MKITRRDINEPMYRTVVAIRNITMKILATLLVMTTTVMVSVPGTHAGPLPAWDTLINSPVRFKVLAGFNGAAVLDRETGLVWERAPGNTDEDRDIDADDAKTWFAAQDFCHQTRVGNRNGWRLPTVQELTSLLDPTQNSPALPIGHPFVNIGTNYWTATTRAANPDTAWTVEFFVGSIVAPLKTDLAFVWCVRSGNSGPEGQ